MPSNLNYPMMARPADGGSSGNGSKSSQAYPVPPSWQVADAAEDEARLTALLDQGERDVAAGRTTDSAEVQRRMRERIQARRSADTPR